MASKSSNVYARIEPDVKQQAEEILSMLGIPASTAINMFYRQIILQQGLPFEGKLPNKSEPLNITDLTKEEIDIELEKGYEDMKSGRTKKASDVFSEIRKDYNI